jgi:hypothetical protein
MEFLGGHFAHQNPQQMSPCRSLYSLIFQQRLATHTALFLFWQLLKQLVVSCEESDLVSEVRAHTILPHLRDLFARGDASDSLDTERGEILEDGQFVKMGRSLVLFLSLQPV